MSSGESVLERAVRLLDVFSADSPELTVGEISRRARLPLPTASRMIIQLVGLGLLARTDDGRVRVGTRLWELGSRAASTSSFRAVALPTLQELHRAVGQHVLLSVLDRETMLLVERLSARNSVFARFRVAERLPAHASAAGLVLLSHASSAAQDRVLAGPLERYTDRTITDSVALRRRLAEIRGHGFVLCAGHVHVDTASVAVPLQDAARHVRAALSVVVPNDERAPAYVPVLTAAARHLDVRTVHP